VDVLPRHRARSNAGHSSDSFSDGVASLGGPLITAGGVMFYSATLDDYLRAYDVTTTRKLWESRLPVGGQVTPMTCRIHGRQMVVVAVGRHGSLCTTPCDTVLACELIGPDKSVPNSP
jgi:quinoprotein glucose dehydrogenase